MRDWQVTRSVPRKDEWSKQLILRESVVWYNIARLLQLKHILDCTLILLHLNPVALTCSGGDSIFTLNSQLL